MVQSEWFTIPIAEFGGACVASARLFDTELAIGRINMSSDGESNCLEISAEPTSEFEAGNRRTNNACKHKCRYICSRPVSFAVNYTCSLFVKLNPDVIQCVNLTEI